MTGLLTSRCGPALPRDALPPNQVDGSGIRPAVDGQAARGERQVAERDRERVRSGGVAAHRSRDTCEQRREVEGAGHGGLEGEAAPRHVRRLARDGREEEVVDEEVRVVARDVRHAPRGLGRG